jgi:hypothetical protein
LVHRVVLAVYAGADGAIPPIYHGLPSPKVGKQALQSMFK